MTTWASRTKPSTEWAGRSQPTTDRDGRNRPIAYEAPLQDAYRIVHDEDDRIIYILSNTGHPIPWTFWKKRPLVS